MTLGVLVAEVVSAEAMAVVPLLVVLVEAEDSSLSLTFVGLTPSHILWPTFLSFLNGTDLWNLAPLQRWLARPEGSVPPSW